MARLSRRADGAGYGAGGALCGAAGAGVFGAALARHLFESAPPSLGLFAGWPAVVLLAGLAALSGWRLARGLGERWPALTPLFLPLAGLLAPDVNPLRSGVLLFGSLLLVLLWLAPSPWDGEKPRRSLGIGEFGLGVSLLALYLLTLSPTVGEADAFEFQVSVARLGIAHGNGYPLLILFGKLFEGLPLGGTQAWRVNLSSAVAAAAAAVGVMAIARRLGAGVRPAGLAAFALGAAPSLWARATEIEAYPLNAALMTACLYLGLSLIDDSAFDPAASHLPLPVLAFIFGLSLTNHLTALMLAPALGFAGLAWLHAGWKRGLLPAALRQLPLAALAFLLGLSVYLYIPLRWPAVGGGEPFTVERLLYFVRGGEAAAQFDPWLPLKEPQRFGYVFRKLTTEFTPAGFALMLLGLAAAFFARSPAPPPLSAAVPSPRRPAGLFLLLAGLGHLYFVLAYNPPEPDFGDFFIAPYTVAAVFIALGLQSSVSFLSRIFPAPIPLLASLALTLFALLPLASLWSNGPRLDLSAGNDRLALGAYTLRQPLATGAALLADPKRFAAPYYLQISERLRPDLEIMLLPDEAAYRAALDERIAAGQTVYLARYLPDLGAGYSLRSVGPLAEVSPAPFLTPPAMRHPLSATLAAGVDLIGYDLEPLDLGPASPRTFALTLYWRAPRTPDASLAVYLRLLDSSGAAAWQDSGALPVNGLYPTNAWRPGETISDFRLLSLPPTLAPGPYQLQAGLFPPFQSVKTGWADVATLPVTAPASAPEPPHRLRARLGENWLVGYEAPETALPDAPVTVTLYWERGEAETVTAFGETRSLAAWPRGAIAPAAYTLRTPPDGEALALTVETGRPARCGWLAPETAGCALPPIRLAGEALPAGAVNFDDQLVLRRATLETPEVARGGVVRVTLEWQGLRTMAESYTVFVHLVGPDGRLYGQRDYWPVEGTRLTTSWPPGEIILDPYTVALPADAPPGAYTVHIGLYRLETLQRLPVLNAAGAPLDDKVVLPGLTVR